MSIEYSVSNALSKFIVTGFIVAIVTIQLFFSPEKEPHRDVYC